MVRYPKPRNAKLTILVPKSILEDLKALRTATFQSTGDLINHLIESELKRQHLAVKEGHELLKIQEARKEKAMSRTESAKDIQSNPDEAESEAIHADVDNDKTPSAEDVDEWSALAKAQDDVSKRRTDAMSYLEWIADSQESICEDSASKYYETVLLSKYKERTAKNHRTRIFNFVRWWNEKLCS